MLLTPTRKARSRLKLEIFAGPARDIYGEEIPKLSREERFIATRSALVNLLHNQHFPSDAEMGRRVRELRDKHDELISLPEIGKYFSQTHIQMLKRLMGQIVERASGERFDEEDIDRFVRLARAGRDHFSNAGYRPEYFVPDNVLFFASLINSKYEVYQETLNHDYVERPIT